MCGNAYSTQQQLKPRLASTVATLIGEATVSVANGYNEILLQQNMQSTTVSLVVLKAASCLLAHHEQGAPDTFSLLCSCLYFQLLL